MQTMSFAIPAGPYSRFDAENVEAPRSLLVALPGREEPVRCRVLQFAATPSELRYSVEIPEPVEEVVRARALDGLSISA